MPFVFENPVGETPTPRESRFVFIDEHTGKQIPAIQQGGAPTFLERVRDYLGIRPPKTTPLDIEAVEQGKRPFDVRQEVFGTGKEEEFRRVLAQGMSGLTGGLSDLLDKYDNDPETTTGAVFGAGAQLTGFLLGPLKAVQGLTGARLAPTAAGLRGVVQIMTKGAADLGLASGLSSIIPSFMESDSFTDIGTNAIESTATGGVIGFLFPAAGAIPTKALRIATTLAVMDKIRAGTGEWFTVDDVFRGLKDGTMDSKELADRAFGYLMDIYFSSRVPTMANQLKGLENAMVRRIREVNPKEAEDTILELSRRGDIRREPVEGVSREEIARAFGAEGDFAKIYEATPQGKARAVEKMYNTADVELEALRSLSFKKLRREVARATLDTSAEVKKQLLERGGEEGRQAVIRHDLIRGASSKAERIYTEAAKGVYDNLTKVEGKVLDRIIQSRRTVVISKTRPDVKHPGGLGGEAHQAYLDSLDPVLRTKLNERADKYFQTMQSQLNDLHKAGLISDQSFKALSEAGDYSPRFFIQHIDPDRSFTFGGKKISIPDSGLKPLEEGSIRSLENNSRLLLQEVVNRTQRRIARNEANQALIALAEAQPENPIARKLKPKEKPKTGEEEVIRGVVKGETLDLAMPTEFARQWVESDPAINSNLANIIGWVSGSKILKPMATGLNPEFALTNMPRDMAHVWITTHEYSPHFPIAIAQMKVDFAEVRNDAIFRRGSYVDYINEGGGMSFLTHQGRVAEGLKGTMGDIQTALGYIGETSEIWTRLALRNRALKNGKAPHEATWIARNYLDFSQGGWMIKALDTGIPYLNATVQATRTVARGAKENPREFTWKIGQMGLAASGLFLANRFINPENWEAVPDREKVNNFVLTTPYSFTDAEGNKRWLYFKIAKDQPQRLMGTIFEALTAKAIGDPVDADQVAQAAQDFLPLIPAQNLPPTLDAMIGYYANKDFWRNEDIWKGPEVEPREEYTSYTHPAFKAIGSVTGLSPERLKHSFQQFFTYGNIYTSLVSAGTAQVMNAFSDEERDATTEEILREAPFLRRVLRATDPFTPFEKQIKEARLESQTTQFKITRDLDQLSEKFYRAQKANDKETLETSKNEIRKFIAQQPIELQKGLAERFKAYGSVFEIPDRRFWLNLKGLSPEARATVFFTRWMQSEGEERERLQKQVDDIPGIVSKRFIIQFNQLRRRAQQSELLPKKGRFVFEE